MKFQDIRIKAQQTKGALKWLVEIVLTLQFFLYWVLFYKINYKVIHAIEIIIKKRYPLSEVNWTLVLKLLNFKSPLLYSFLIDLLLIPGIYFILKFNSSNPVSETKNEKIIRGAVIKSEREYKKIIAGKEIFCYIGTIPIAFEMMFRNILIMGATGSGKTQVISKILSEGYNNFDFNAIIYDSKKDFVPKFYNQERDIIFNPADARCPAWNMLDEVENRADAATIAEVIIPEPDKSNPNGYFITNARLILESLIMYLKMHNTGSNEELIKLAAKPPDELIKMLTADANIADEFLLAIRPLGSDEIKSIMTEISSHLKAFMNILPSKPDKPGMKSFNITRDFLKKNKTRIFLNLDKNSEIFAKPIMKIFVELLVRKFLSVPDGKNTRTLFIFDELTNFERTDNIADLLDKGRSKNASVILGIQDIARCNSIYGQELTENMMNSCNSSIYLRVNGDKEAEYISRQIGSQEVERLAASDSVTDDKYTHSKSTSIIEKKLFLPSEIKVWPDLFMIAKFVNIPFFLQISIQYKVYAEIAKGLIESDRLRILQADNTNNTESEKQNINTVVDNADNKDKENTETDKPARIVGIDK